MDKLINGMNSKVIQVIQSTLFVRGKEGSKSNPPRVIVQYFSLDGQLLAEVDPIAIQQQQQSETSPVSENNNS